MTLKKLLLGSLAAGSAATNSLPPLPPLPTTPSLGYSTWNSFPHKGIGEAECTRQADAMHADGLVAAGYSVFIVDEPCFVGRDNATGELLENRTAWPRGLAAFGAHLRTLNMTLGVYTDAGPKTCAGCVASFGHEAQDMATFRRWGASYVKVDRCFGVDSEPMRAALPLEFAKFRRDATGADSGMVLSAILAGTDNCWEWGRNGSVIAGCRTTGDIRNSFGSFVGNLDGQESTPAIEAFAGPAAGGGGTGGGAGEGTAMAYYNDLDMLLIGVQPGTTAGPGLSHAEARSHLALWAALKSPLLIGANVPNLTTAQLELLTNAEMIAVNQDPLGRQARRLAFTGSADHGVSYQACACASGAVPCPAAAGPADDAQRWSLSSAQGGQLVHIASGQCLTLENCGATRNAAVSLCPCDTAAPGAPAACRNTTCAGAGRSWSWQGVAGGKPGHLTADGFGGMCLQAILGPQRTTLRQLKCNDADPRQQWAVDAARATVQAEGEHCLSARPLPTANATTDKYVGPLSSGSSSNRIATAARAVAVLFNRGGADATATLDFAADLGWQGGKARVRDVWARQDLGEFEGSWSATVATHDVAFLTLEAA